MACPTFVATASPTRTISLRIAWRFAICVTLSTALAAAYAIDGQEKYAEKAVALLKVFFLDEATKMNPSLLYAQAIPGRSSGRGVGIIDTLHLAEVPPAIMAIDKSRAMTPDIRAGLKKWFADYAQWMTTHPYGLDEMNAKNNHSVAFMVQLAAFARLTGDAQKLDLCRRRYKEVFVPQQMAPDGSFPQELARTKPYGYSIFQLDNMAILCQLLSTPEDNLWAFTLPDGRGIRRGRGVSLSLPAGQEQMAAQARRGALRGLARPTARPALCRLRLRRREGTSTCGRRSTPTRLTPKCSGTWP